jgi:hypothetical protein
MRKTCLYGFELTADGVVHDQHETDPPEFFTKTYYK